VRITSSKRASWCRATDKTWQLDTPAARAFLDDFVNLP
jgi:hypothetical protein